VALTGYKLMLPVTYYLGPFGENKGIMFQAHCQVFDEYESGNKAFKLFVVFIVLMLSCQAT
jgi:hypothetical protein